MTTPQLGVPPQSDSEPSGSRINAPSEQDIQRPTMPAITPDGPSTDRPPTVLKFGSGRSVVATENGGEEQIEIRASGGGVLLSMRLTADGPVLSLSAASVEIAAAKTLSLRAETLSIAAEKDLTIEAGGSLLQKVAGHAERQVGGTDRVRACDIEMTAH